ncbi:MarR family winged helix-turn-helix transcriptional regulator [Methylobacterium nonmethylotrophicum]|uniref:MarR family transcriptional regulator n=1 Tax=Methylobacterium nonmethylotrophicum TaxID=1141884 RepID=A0A4Z0NGY6_9HYPH|nr:MarR family winged helix-turn-helix transcriptional regulator [Methylobacterium nonmethylotrophicum]TGD94820.1 MarR family transcriptional regulator [Methylobacterium nonmethylotrophicum]
MTIQPTRCSNAALRRATRRVGQLYDDALAPSGLRTTQYGLLAMIRGLGAPTMGELAEAMVMDLSGLAHTLKPLTRDGYVSVVPDPQDRRARRITLTSAGAAKIKEATPLWRSAQARFEAAFGPDRADLLRDLLWHLASPDFQEAFGAQGAGADRHERALDTR